MRAAYYDSYGDSVLRVGEQPDPKFGPAELLVQVRAAGVNPVDWKVMAGGLDPMMDAVFPVVPGWDVAGVVKAVGPDTPEFSVGDEVIAYARKDDIHGGTFAELVTVPVRAAAGKPTSFTWEQAGALPLAGLTALRCLDRLAVDAKDTVLIYAASGGVGSMAVQLARHRGARVIGTASPKNHAYVAALGGEPISYGDGLVERVRELAPDGVTAVVDLVGGLTDTTAQLLAPGGRQVSTVDPKVAEAGGELVWVRPDGAALTYLAALADSDVLTVDVADIYGLEDVGQAFATSRDGHTRGKLVIRFPD
ncbi:NADP-dependent oxidoreductase [Actinocorallia lasiicapitis]